MVGGPLPEPFEYREDSTKVWCSVCGQSGYNGGSWMEKHQRPHVECPECGKHVTDIGLGSHRFRKHGVRKTSCAGT